MSNPDRRTYLGSGDIAAVAGLSPYKGPVEVWAQKLGLSEDVATSPQMQVGIALERPIIEDLFARPRGLSVSPSTFYRAAEADWAGARPDAIAHEGDGKNPRVIECKVVGMHFAHRWGPEGDANGVPPDVMAQVQWQLWCSEHEIANVVALLGTDLRVYIVERDKELIADLRRVAESFWAKVRAREMPPITPEHAEQSRALLAHLYPKHTRDLEPFTEETRSLAEQYITARSLCADAEKQKSQSAALLEAAIGEREGFYCDGLRATWKAPESGTPAWKAIALLAGASPELIAEHTPKGSRRLDVRESKVRK